MAFAIVAALVIEWLRARGSATGDLALALVFYGGIAGGVVLASRSGRRTPTSSRTCSARSSRPPPTTCGPCSRSVRVIIVTIAFIGRALLAVVLDEDAGARQRDPRRRAQHRARRAHRGDGRRGDAHRRRAARRRADGAAGRDEPARRHGRSGARCSARSPWASRRRCSGWSRPGSGRSRRAAPIVLVAAALFAIAAVVSGVRHAGAQSESLLSGPH